MTKKQVFVRATATTCAAVWVVALSGCVPNPIDLAMDRATDEIAQGGAEELGDLMTGEDVDIEFGSIPDDFPDEVPLVSTDVMHSMKISGEEGEGISLAVADSRDPADVAQAIRDDFADWEETAWVELGELVSGQFTMEGLSVLVSVVEEDGGSAVSYIVYRE